MIWRRIVLLASVVLALASAIHLDTLHRKAIGACARSCALGCLGGRPPLRSCLAPEPYRGSPALCPAIPAVYGLPRHSAARPQFGGYHTQYGVCVRRIADMLLRMCVQRARQSALAAATSTTRIPGGQRPCTNQLNGLNGLNNDRDDHIQSKSSHCIQHGRYCRIP